MPSIVGTWKLVGARARDRDGKPLPEPYGGKGLGRVMFNADGRMMAVTCDGRTDLPRAERLTIPLAGDGAEAKAQAGALIEEIGFAALDTGSLAEGGRLQQPGGPFFNRPLLLPDAEHELASARG